MRLLLSLSSSSSLFSSSWTVIALFLTTLLTLTLTTKVQFVRADLKYYVYVNEKEPDSNKVVNVVLESYGSLPLNESISTKEGDSCPTNSGTNEGGVNPHYLCVGPNYLGNSIEFFPIGPANETKNEQKLPFKFSSFEESYGTSSGLLLWRNVLAIDLSSTGDNSINGKSYGIDKSNNNYNTEWLLSNKNPAEDTTAVADNGNGNDNDNENNNVLIAEWYLLNKMNGQPIFNDGLIQLIQGQPPSVPDRTSSSSAVPVVVVSEAVATATKEAATIVVKEEESESDTNNCESITESICSDDNDSSFSTFCSLLIQVGLDTMLHHNHILSSSESANTNTNSFYTIYVPTNDAFTKAYQNESISSPPQMLSGHDLTKLLLNHIIGNDSLPVPYEKMLCGTKTYMLNGQITKIGCNANAIVSYVMGVSGNGIHNNSIKPKFVLKNNNNKKKKNCNGIIHMVDYVILPSQDNDGEEYHEDMITEFTSTTIDIAQEKEEEEEAIVAAQEDDHDDNDSDPFAFFKGEEEDSSSTVTTVITARTTTTTTTNSASAKLRPVSTKIVGSSNATDNTAGNTSTNIDIDIDKVDVEDNSVLTVIVVGTSNNAATDTTNTNIDKDEVAVEDNGVPTVNVGNVEDNGVLTVNVGSNVGSNSAADNTNIDIHEVDVEDNGILTVNVGSNAADNTNTNIESQQVQGNSNNNDSNHRQLLRRRRN
ncbi:hypothetical protein FRACYDRAFT_258189 [Fragilariopsis cylindrus CCMP1102]|uniref:FAS1 domain-containing protein n=1 Tax=Fragilariopsis cylindrus CCMP1102 TaxID=635003 RepID=A0A1E7EIS7_9STRA|nr:hypothetical protein FRACYDRAFT_258189 [Fragilariopsis cylindrus CCMP1102]|eukprot:OEU05795.1 hypothetical protein FRACYDRAFT_258189 [Fragilariopsis cylindrus CCMP1102]